MNPYTLPATTHSYLERAAESLREAITSAEVPTRYATAHVAALLAARAAPATPRRRGQKNDWVLLAEVAPELTEWAAFFASGASKRAAAEAGSTRAVTEREMWRVEAGTGMTNAGVFDLSFSWSDGRWQLVGCAD